MEIQYKKLTQLVYENLHSEILTGRLTPGSRIKQEEVTHRLGVSRTPVREAIQRLEAEGLIEFPRRGLAVVTRLSRKRIDEIFDLRALLEGYATSKAIDNLTKKDMHVLRRLIREMDECHSSQQGERLAAKNEEFHRLICSRGGNDALLELLEQIWRDIRRLRINYLITPQGHEESTRQHESLLDALESHAQSRVHEIVQVHALSSKEGILKALGLSSAGH